MPHEENDGQAGWSLRRAASENRRSAQIEETLRGGLSEIFSYKTARGAESRQSLESLPQHTLPAN